MHRTGYGSARSTGCVLRNDGVLKRAPRVGWQRRRLSWPYRAPDGALWIVAAPVPGGGRPAGAGAPPAGPAAHDLDAAGPAWRSVAGYREPAAHFRPWPGAAAGRPEPGRTRGQPARGCRRQHLGGSQWGLYRLRETLFSSFTERDGLSGDYVRTVFEDRDRQLWVGSASGPPDPRRSFPRGAAAQPRRQGALGTEPGTGAGR